MKFEMVSRLSKLPSAKLKAYIDFLARDYAGSLLSNPKLDKLRRYLSEVMGIKEPLEDLVEGLISNSSLSKAGNMVVINMKDDDVYSGYTSKQIASLIENGSLDIRPQMLLSKTYAAVARCL